MRKLNFTEVEIPGPGLWFHSDQKIVDETANAISQALEVQPLKGLGSPKFFCDGAQISVSRDIPTDGTKVIAAVPHSLYETHRRRYDQIAETLRSTLTNPQKK